MSMNSLLIEGTVAVSASMMIATATSAEPLITAIISFATTLVTMVGGELIKFLIAFIKSKTKKYEEKEDNTDGTKSKIPK